MTPLRDHHAAARLLRGLALLVLALALAAVPARAEAPADTEYIVHYRPEAAGMGADSALPFDVVSGAELEYLLDLDLIEWYEENGEAQLLEAEPQALLLESTYYDAQAQWNLDMIGAELAFDRGLLGQGVRVGIIDSGVSPHEALGDRLLPGHCYIKDAADPADTADTLGHGTKVAGLIAGAGEDGYIGAAPMAELVPLKCTDGNSVKIDAICAAIYDGVDVYHCDVLNLSLGTSNKDHTKFLEEAVNYAVSQGVIVVAAAGNRGDDTLYYPAGFDNVIGVGSVNTGGAWYGGSTHNSSVFLCAPGKNVRSTTKDGGYATGSGTSFATPQVSAAVAVLLSIDPDLGLEDIMALLAATALDRGAEGYDEYCGYGILNLSGCVLALTGEGLCGFQMGEAGWATAVRNHTGRSLECVYLLAEYSDTGQLCSLVVITLELPALGSAELPAPAEDGLYGQFLCRADTFAPLLEAVKSPQAVQDGT